MSTYVVIRGSEGGLHKLDRIRDTDSCMWLEGFGFDFPSPMTSTRDADSNGKAPRSIEAGAAVSQQSATDKPHAVEFIVYRGEVGLEVPVASKQLSLDSITNTLAASPMSDHEDEPNFEPHAFSVNIVLNSKTGTLFRFRHICKTYV